MKKRFFVAAGLFALATAASAADVGVSISIGEPNFYGRIDLGGMPPPQVVYSEPVIVERPAHYVNAAPIYLHVPPGFERHWDKHCREYGACGQPVYFVTDGWYQRQYVPAYHARREREYEHRGEWHEAPREHGHGEEWHEERREHEDHGEHRGWDHDRDHDHDHDRRD